MSWDLNPHQDFRPLSSCIFHSKNFPSLPPNEVSFHCSLHHQWHSYPSRWTEFLGVRLDTSWTLATVCVFYHPLLSLSPLKYTWNPSTSLHLYHHDTNTGNNHLPLDPSPRLLSGSTKFTLIPFISMWPFPKTNVIPCWKVPDTVWSFLTLPNTPNPTLPH